ncbi:hypothetical protein BSZ39_12140 [Bowdeniella nasicola]|uniref:CRISPR-associated endonuclease Cas1 n=1 Tax=Bowdeniella nasicola TaxID=208480 RepID=A0A1Q5PZ94_9ACTO|nr:type I-E CRISPR-associated endonuclease Cas1e [Bowdeniella nasicola]OKL52951.1 hypothetical protein BSZ39_12140 [Bowdeniella nasicola]
MRDSTAECGTTTVWVGDQGVRYYAHGRGLTTSSHLLEAQARASSNRNERLEVARRMYTKRFAGESVDAFTMQQLRGREGVRMARIYRSLSARYGVAWGGRSYDADDFSRSDPINAAISSANAALYGLVHSVIVALGCSPGLGIVHNGNSRAFVFDIADLYKADVFLPIAFEAVAETTADLFGEVRRRMRDRMKRQKLISQIVHDIQEVLGVEPELEASVVSLWDYQQGKVSAGTNWGSSWPS